MILIMLVLKLKIGRNERFRKAQQCNFDENIIGVSNAPQSNKNFSFLKQRNIHTNAKIRTMNVYFRKKLNNKKIF